MRTDALSISLLPHVQTSITLFIPSAHVQPLPATVSHQKKPLARLAYMCQCYSMTSSPCRPRRLPLSLCPFASLSCCCCPLCSGSVFGSFYEPTRDSRALPGALALACLILTNDSRIPTQGTLSLAHALCFLTVSR
jgi:hypothetical protein